MGQANIFINYRRSLNAAVAGRLYDRLSNHFDKKDLFIDVDALPPGVDFVKALDERVSRCNLFVAIIGPNWTSVSESNGGTRLNDPNDYVRVEIASALARDIPVIPVLVDGAEMPTADELPDNLKPLVRRNAVEITHARFGPEVDQLASSIAKILGTTTKEYPSEKNDALVRNPRTLSEILFSFSGRLARRPYWKGVSLYIAAVTILAFSIAAFLIALEGIENVDKIASINVTRDWRARFLTLIVGVPLLWPYSALMRKRLNDLNAGVWIFWCWLVFLLTINVFFALGYVSEQAHNMLTVFSVTVAAFLGLIEGTKGDNKFGPDPLRPINVRPRV